MTSGSLQRVTITLNDGQGLSGLLVAPPTARACYVIAHGVGAGMEHPFMGSVAQGLPSGVSPRCGINFHICSVALSGPTLRQWPMPPSGRRSRQWPSSPRIVRHCGREIVWQPHDVSSARRLAIAWSPGPGLPWLPLHPAGRPSEERGTHLFEVRVPMLFLQGSRDRLADLQVLQPLVMKLGARATLKLLLDADHSFHVGARTGEGGRCESRNARRVGELDREGPPVT